MHVLRTILVLSLSMLAVAAGAVRAGQESAAAEEMKRAEMTATVLHEMMSSEGSAIPDALLERAQAVAVISQVVKGAFGTDARHGKGLVSSRTETGAWGSPVFVSLNDLRYGTEAVIGDTDVVLVFTDKGLFESLVKDKVKLGGEAGIPAGPIGRAAKLGANDSGVYAYARSKGTFAGVALSGAELDVDDDANRAVYGKTFDAKSSATSREETPAGLNAFLNALEVHREKQS